MALLLLAVFAQPLQAQVVKAPVSTSVTVPIVGNVAGLDARWVTSVDLRNDTGTDAEVWLLLPTAPDAPAFNVSIARGQRVTLPDVVADAFGTDTALSPMRVVTSGSRSVTIAATVMALRNGAIAATQPIPIDYVSIWAPYRALPGLSFSDDYRTNIGLVNLSEEHAADFTLAVQRISGRNIAVTHVTLPAASLIHTSIQSLFPAIAKGDDFTVIIETGDPETWVYGSVISNATSQARFVSPVIGGPIGGAPIEP